MPTFIASIDRFRHELDVAAQERKKELARNILRAAIERSPEDTSHFISNWLVSYSGPQGERPGVDPGGQRTLAEGLALIDLTPEFSDIVISNAVPYAQRLEDGHSLQAPRGVLRPASAEGLSRTNT